MDYNQNNYNQDNYQENYYQDPYGYVPEPQKQSGIGIAAMVLGIVAFFVNPLYLCSLTALILGIIGACKKDSKKGCAITGIILGVVSVMWQIVFDFVLSIFTGGLGIVSFFC